MRNSICYAAGGIGLDVCVGVEPFAQVFCYVLRIMDSAVQLEETMSAQERIIYHGERLPGQLRA